MEMAASTVTPGLVSVKKTTPDGTTIFREEQE
jgi:hypothetical protein